MPNYPYIIADPVVRDFINYITAIISTYSQLCLRLGQVLLLKILLDFISRFMLNF